MRRNGGWALPGIILIGALGISPTPAGAAIPIYPNPTIIEIDRIVTNPFAGSTATDVVGDAEGMTRDPVRNTLWLSDDKNSMLHEIDLVTRRKVGEVTAAQFAATPNLVDGAPAGLNRIGDNEGVAYDDVTDTMYVFSGSCCTTSPHTPTVFRLKRPSPGAAFVPESYQRLEDRSPNDFGAADVLDGKLYTSYRDPVRGWNQLHTFDYVTRTLSAPIANLREVSGWVSSLAFSDDGTDMWVTSTSNNLYRYNVPSYTLVPGHEWSSVYAFGKMRDARAIEIIDDLLYVADGYDGHSKTSKSAFAIHIWQVAEVSGPPVASFTTNPATPTGPAPFEVKFSDTSTGLPTDWLWEWGDGTPNSTGREPSHTYITPGTYTVRLTASNALGTSTTSGEVTVTGSAVAPVAAFTSNRSAGVAPLSVNFTDTSTGAPTTWSWDFGDGGAGATTRTPTRVFTTPGTYTVRLTVSNANGSSQATKVITVSGAPTTPVAAFDATPTGGNAPLTVQFTNTSTGSPTPSASWTFGDGSPAASATNPSHVFTAPGTYTVTLVVSNAAGSSSTSRTITVTPPPVAPVAAFTASAQSGRAPLTVQFTNTSTGAPAPAVTWSFGDGGADSTAANPTRTFAVPGTYDVILRATNVAGAATASKRITVTPAPAPDPEPEPPTPAFVGMSPIRLLDTRRASTVDGESLGEGPLGGGRTTSVRVTGRGGLPATGVGAVALNVTAVGPTDESYVTVWPSGQPRPTASNLNLVPRRTTPNMVVVPVGVDGSVSLYNDAGATDLIVDLLGWFPTGARFTGVNPARVLDTRPAPTLDGRESGIGPFRAGVTRSIPIAGRAGVPPTGAGAVAVNITAVGATAPTYLTAFPNGSDRPTASNLNVVPGRVAANMAILPLGPDGRVSIYNDAGSVDVLVDVLGWFPVGSGFTPLAGARLTDSRPAPTIDGRFSGLGPLPGEATRSIPILGRGGVPLVGVGAVVLNVTAVDSAGPSYLTVWPSGAGRPTASNLNVEAEDTVPNLVIVPVGADGQISFFNESGSVGLIVDVLGWFPTFP